MTFPSLSNNQPWRGSHTSIRFEVARLITQLRLGSASSE
jgi:hypothetical protein